MSSIKNRFFLTIIVIMAFFGPFLAVMAIENAKRENKMLGDQMLAAVIRKDAEDARYQYYLGVADQRDSLKQAMADAKTQYEQLLTGQPQAIKDGQTTVSQTTMQPVVTQKVVQQPVTTTVTSSASASKPKSSSKTKTS